MCQVHEKAILHLIDVPLLVIIEEIGHQKGITKQDTDSKKKPQTLALTFMTLSILVLDQTQSVISMLCQTNHLHKQTTYISKHDQS